MIENRARIERQIFAGRQEVRRILKSKVNLKNPNNPNLLSVPGTSSQDGRPANQPRSPATSRERIPLSVDTDAERAFTQGASWFYRRGRRSRPESPSPDDPLRSPALRKKWTSDLLSVPNSGSDSANGNEENARQGDKPQRTISHSTSLPSPSIFSRFRTNSFIQGFKSRITSPPDEAPHDGLNSDSEESSSDDDDEDWSPDRYRLSDSPAFERRALAEDIGVDS